MRRTTLRTLLALVLALVFVAPVAAVTPGGAAEETLTGVLEQVIVEDLDPGRSHEEFTLRTPRGLVELRFADGGPDGHGRRDGHGDRPARRQGAGRRARRAPAPACASSARRPARAWARNRSPSRPLTARRRPWPPRVEATATSAVAKSVALILINFTDLTTQPFTKSEVQAAAHRQLDEPQGLLRGGVEGPDDGHRRRLRLVHDRRRRPPAATGGRGTPSPRTRRPRPGVNLAAYTNVMFVWPQTSQCGFAGVGYVPGKYTYLNGTISVQVMTHEVGHNFGLSHANARDCIVGGTRVTIARRPSAARRRATRTRSRTMGNNALRHNHGSHLGELGWLERVREGRSARPATRTRSRPTSAAGRRQAGPRSRAATGRSSTSTSARRTAPSTPSRPARPPSAGVTIRIGVGTASPTTSPKPTELLDTTPATTRPQGRAAARRQDDDRPGLDDLVHDDVGRLGRGRRPGPRGDRAPAPGSVTPPRRPLPLGRRSRWAPATDNVAVAGVPGQPRRDRRGTIPAAGHVLDRHGRRARRDVHVRGRGRRHVRERRPGGERLGHGPGDAARPRRPIPRRRRTPRRRPIRPRRPTPPRSDPGARPHAHAGPDPDAAPDRTPQPPTAPEPVTGDADDHHRQPHAGARRPTTPASSATAITPQRHARRDGDRRRDLEGHRRARRDHVHVHRDGARRGGQRERRRRAHRHDDGRHGPPVDADELPQGRALRRVRHVRLVAPRPTTSRS